VNAHMERTMKWLNKVAIALAAAGALASGCSGEPPSMGSDEQSIRLADLPNVPGCAEVRSAVGALTARAIAGVDDLYLVYADQAALCIDSYEGIVRRFGAAVGWASSNPMPGEGQRASSNPMPGNPTDTASSNPMPGIDPYSSNPMPGTDPCHAGVSHRSQ
jgi:hypothetical protein